MNGSKEEALLAALKEMAPAIEKSIRQHVGPGVGFVVCVFDRDGSCMLSNITDAEIVHGVLRDRVEDYDRHRAGATARPH